MLGWRIASSKFICVECRKWISLGVIRRTFSQKSDTSENVSKISGPLSGYRILDLSRVLAGPYCTMILGDLGAEVIKVERPGFGDDTRSWGPPFKGPEAVYFLTVNRNKKSVAVDIKSKKGQAIIRQLAGECDVLVENYIPGKLDEYNLGYQQLKTDAPRLIYCSISGYGQTGPYAKRAGYDVIVSGVAGLMHITGPKDGEPCKVGVAMTDLSTGLYAHGAIMAAILQRQTTGQGQHIDCDLFSTQVASLVNIGSNYLNKGMEATRHGTAHPSIVPYQAFQTKDSYILVGAGNDGQFKILCKVLNLEHLHDDEKYSTNKARVANREELLGILTNMFSSNSTQYWLNLLEDSGIPYGPINNMEAVFNDPQALHNNLLQEIVHPTAGNIRIPGPPVRLSDFPRPCPTAPPTLGQHTDHVMKDILKLETDEIEQLRREHVIQ
ncbi:succinate--hydroxymethylglutarate CoA-transferase-like [Ostrea edulis]|uniref:succinate--hydroxymethylglutarate CoA-transferase-like n=1 Tax=Ostrea edulis TaxID=37623 RepID=UPI0024AFD3CD|nr:succinate--hydroxymethylglutarate CoA-transferase-like [Ostrea edulis]